MTSITTWLRLEPLVRTTEMRGGLQARVYDPLWLLARQWQVGEFQGQDAGSPAAARWHGEAAPLTRFFPGVLPEGRHVDGQALDSATPLEALVEREQVRPAPDHLTGLRLAADAGLHFLRLLALQPNARNHRDAIRAAFAFAPLSEHQRAELDPDSLAFIDLVLPRVPDGRKLYAALRALGQGGGLPPGMLVTGEGAAEVQATALTWLHWYETLFAEPGQGVESWSPERMEYTFSVAAPLDGGERVLTAREYHGGRLDWYDFSVDQDAALHAGGDPPGVAQTRTVMPAPVSYRGMPNPRFWAFEDARVDFGALDAGPEDLARLLLIEFALTFGSDWFVIPVELPIGSLCRTTSLVVTNTFGERYVIPSRQAAGPRHAAWRMFTLSAPPEPTGAPAQEELFFMPPALIAGLESRPIEEVLFVRDEMANMAWGVERTTESATERPLSRQDRRSTAPQQAASANEQPAYRLTTGAPEHWVPLLPIQTPSGTRLRRARMLAVDGEPHAVAARGRILTPQQHDAAGLALFEEEVPREGLRVTRAYQLARWHDGTTHLWVGRRKIVGRGEGSSGLRFDQLEPRS